MPRTVRRSKTGAMSQAAEIAMAAPLVIALRSARMLAAGVEPNARDRREFRRMGVEKGQAYVESMNAMAMQTYRECVLHAMRLWWAACCSPRTMLSWCSTPRSRTMSVPLFGFSAQSQKEFQRSFLKVLERGLMPVHRRATGNARRLMRPGKR